MNEATLVDADGVEVFYRSWVPASPRAIVLILHGASEHSGRYTRFGAALADAGYAAYAIDHRGFGRTARSTGIGTAGPGEFDRVLESVHALQQLAQTEVGPLQVVVFGHSMGSVFTQVYAQVYGSELAGFALSGSFGPSPDLQGMLDGLQAAVAGGMADTPVDALATFNAAFEPARTTFDWLSRDEAEVDAYLADPLAGDAAPMTYGYVLGVFGLLQRGVDETQIAEIPTGLPVLLVTGGADPVSGGGATVRLLEESYRSAGLEVTSHYYPEARHELLNEINRDEVLSDILDWLKKVV